MKTIQILFLLIVGQLAAQQTAIQFELNGRPSNTELQDSNALSNNPFVKFIGEWTLKEDRWIQNWGGNNDTIKIPNHHTVSCQINTENSLLSIIDGPEPNGHIFWSYNPNTKEVAHLSSFGTIRAGKGGGNIDSVGNLTLKVSFEGETLGTYRIYTYKWLSDNEYELNSIQYDKEDKPTGLFYKGNFIRIKSSKSIREEIEAIFSILDDNDISKKEQVKVYTHDVRHMAPNQPAITSKKDLLAYLKQQKAYGYADMKHEIIEFSQHGDIVIVRGKVTGQYHPNNGGKAITFQTKNMFVLQRIKSQLKIASVIYNASPSVK